MKKLVSVFLIVSMLLSFAMPIWAEAVQPGAAGLSVVETEAASSSQLTQSASQAQQPVANAQETSSAPSSSSAETEGDSSASASPSDTASTGAPSDVASSDSVPDSTSASQSASSSNADSSADASSPNGANDASALPQPPATAQPDSGTLPNGGLSASNTLGLTRIFPKFEPEGLFNMLLSQKDTVLTGQLSYIDTSTYKTVPLLSETDWNIQLDGYDVALPSNAVMADYVNAAIEKETGKLTLTVKKETPLTEGEPRLVIRATNDTMSVYFEIALKEELIVEGFDSGIFWYDLTSAKGRYVMPSFKLNGVQTFGLTQLGTPIGSQIEVTLKNEDDTKSLPIVCMPYVAGSDTLVFKLNAMPALEEITENWTVTLRVPYEEGYTLVSRFLFTEKNLNSTMQIDQDNVMSALSDKAGSELKGKLTFKDINQNELAYLMGPDFSFDLSSDGIVLGPGETIGDYVGVAFDRDTNMLTFTAKKDMTLKNDKADLTLFAKNYMFQFTQTISVGRSTLRVSYYNPDNTPLYSFMLEKGNKKQSIPKIERNGFSPISFQDAGLTFDVAFFCDDQKMEDAEKYFGVEIQNGIITLEVKQVPPVYTGTKTHRYKLRVAAKDGSYDVDQYCTMNFSTPTASVILCQQGKQVPNLPITKGTYTYEMQWRASQDALVEIPKEGLLQDARLNDGYTADGTRVPIPKEDYEISVDFAARTLTYTLHRDLPIVKSDLFLALAGKEYIANAAIPIGKRKLNLYLGGYKYDLQKSDANTPLMLVGMLENGGADIPLGALNGTYRLETNENGTVVPLEESKYLTASIEKGLLTFQLKQDLPPEENRIGITIFYTDDKYVGTTTFYFREKEIEEVNNQIFTLKNIKTGGNMTVGNPGTVEAYRVQYDAYHATGLVTQPAGKKISGITVETTANLNLDDYVAFSYDAVSSLLTVTWKQKLPLYGADITKPYSYVWKPVMTDGSVPLSAQNLFAQSVYVKKGDNEIISKGSLPMEQGQVACYSLTSFKKFDEGSKVVFTDSQGNVLENTALHGELTDYNALQLTVGENCPVGEYIMKIYATSDEKGTFWTGVGCSVEVLEKESPSYLLRNIDIAGKVHIQSVPAGSKNESIDFFSIMTTEISLENNAPFEVAAGNEAGVEKTQTGYRITWGRVNNKKVSFVSKNQSGAEITTTIYCYSVEASFLREGAAVPTTSLFSDTWVVGQEYKIYPLQFGKKMSELGNKLKYAFIEPVSQYYEISAVGTDFFTIKPKKTANSQEIYNEFEDKNCGLKLTYEDANGSLFNLFTVSISDGTILPKTSRLQLVDDKTGKIVTKLNASHDEKEFSLRVNADLADITKVEFASNAPNSIELVQDTKDMRKVQLKINNPLFSSHNYVYAIVTLKNGTKTSAYVGCSWDSVFSSNDYMPNGYQLSVGTKNESGAYIKSYGTSYSLNYDGTQKAVRNKLYVFYSKYNSALNRLTYLDTMEAGLVKDLNITSETEGLTILRQGTESGTTYFEYECDVTRYGEYNIKATATLGDGTTRSFLYTISVVEETVNTSVTVKNDAELRAALESPQLLPATTICLKPGTYTGDYKVDIPVSITSFEGTSVNVNEETGTINGFLKYDIDTDTQTAVDSVIFKGSLTALVPQVSVSRIHFAGSGIGTALTDIQWVSSCIFTNYGTAIETEKNLAIRSNTIVNSSAFENNQTAVRFHQREYCSSVALNTFIKNKVAIEILPDCKIESSYSPLYGTTINKGTMSRNKFYLREGQEVIRNEAKSEVQFNLGYNYYRTVNAQNAILSEKPAAAMFTGTNKTIYNPFYDTPACQTISTDKKLDDIADDKGNSKLTLAASQNSSNSNTADSTLNLGTSTFDELKNSQKAQTLEIDVKSTSGETDINWSFDKNDLKPDYAGASVNLGVAFSFTDFEYNMVNNIVKKSAETEETLGDITYQAMCFAHSGDLPGKATIKVRMNESLMAYYLSHNNSFADFKVYFLNEKTNKLEKMNQPLTVTIENGAYFYTMDISHCSSYLVTTQDLNTDIVGVEKISSSVYEINETDKTIPGLQANVSLETFVANLNGGKLTVKNAQGVAVTNPKALIGTGYTVGMGEDGTTGQLTVIVPGDLDGDGTIAISDVVTIRRSILNILELKDANAAAGTFTSKAERPNINDLTTLRRFLLRIISTLG